MVVEGEREAGSGPAAGAGRDAARDGRRAVAEVAEPAAADGAALGRGAHRAPAGRSSRSNGSSPGPPAASGSDPTSAPPPAQAPASANGLAVAADQQACLRGRSTSPSSGIRTSRARLWHRHRLSPASAARNATVSPAAAAAGDRG